MTRSLDDAIRAFAPSLPLGVAFSGGADSTALLLACAAKWPGRVVALHVNHGLQAAAAAFELHCVRVCAELQLPLHIQKVDARHAPGQSPEDAARQARYLALFALARMGHAGEAIKSVALAQHADDQVETLLLALSRGAGLGGLSAMPAQWQRNGLDFYRPLLGVSAQDIRHWLAARNATFIEDPSNTDQRFTRNRIRARVLPALQAVFPQFRETFGRSAGHVAQAQALLLELAAQDLALVERAAAGAVCIQALQALSPARQANCLRHWLKQRHATTPTAAQLAELMRQIQACRTRGHRIHIKVGQGFVQRRGDVLDWYNPQVLLP